MAPAPEPLDEALYPELTARQRTAIPVVLAAPTVGAGIQAADIARSTWYRWRQDAGFRRALVRCQREVFGEALADLQSGARFGVSTLLSLLTSEDERVRLAAARDIVTLAMRAAELFDLGERLGRLEDALRPLVQLAEVDR